VSKKTIALDFDGVIHKYTTPWTSPEEIPDGPVSGALDAVKEYLENDLEVIIFSTRANTAGGIIAILTWLEKHGFPTLQVTAEKPRALVYVDDRGFHFGGVFPAVSYVKNFKPWNRR
jgi:hypothetical protein